ncbi:MAG: hypothetical protein WC320_02005 [Candidatus Paceibacterota bacterium]|jgi:hypothetical protein
MPHSDFASWYKGENKIQKEIKWLSNSIDTFSNEERLDQKIYNEILSQYLLRNIALLILSGRIHATEITKKLPLILCTNFGTILEE